MDTFRQDILYAFRRLLKAPGFTVVAVLTLGLGIGANSAIFSVVNGVLLEPLPFPQSDRLIGLYHLWENEPAVMSPPNFLDTAAAATTIQGAAAYDETGYTLTGVGDPVRIDGAEVSASFFDVLRVRPALGRVFTQGENEPGRVNVAVLSHTEWRDRFGADPSIVSRRIQLNGESFEVVGVMPEGFAYPETAVIWTPFEYDQNFRVENRGAWYLATVARLKDGVSLDQANAELATIAARLRKDFPDDNANVGLTARSLKQMIVGDTRDALLVLLGAVGFVLLIACANVANLMLARAAAREQELAVRAALGASRLRLLRQLLTESIALGVLGGTLGLIIAAWAADLLVAMEPADLPRLHNIGVDGAVVAFTAITALVTAAIFGMIPAFQMTRRSLTGSLRDRSASSQGGVRGNRVRGALVVAEMALAVLLLVGAGLLLRSFGNLMRVDPGFTTEQALTFRVSLPAAEYNTTQKRRLFFESLLERVRAIPGVTSASSTFILPLSGSSFNFSFAIEGRPPFPNGQEPTMETRIVSPGYFETMGIRLVRGRWFEQRDNASGEQVVVLGENAARQFFSFGDPIGQRIKIGLNSGGIAAGGTVIGIVSDVRENGLGEALPTTAYIPHGQCPLGAMTVVARTAVDGESIAPQARAALAALDPKLPMSSVRTLDAQIRRSVAQPRFYAMLLGSFAVLALVLASIGIFGVMSYLVTARRKEIGIRLALGAQRDRVMRMVLTHALTLGTLGVLLGLGASWYLTKYLAAQLFQLQPTDPVTFATVAGVLMAVALFASWMPARRATKVDPMIALRAD